MYACAGGHEDVVRVLLEAGANVEVLYSARFTLYSARFTLYSARCTLHTSGPQ